MKSFLLPLVLLIATSLTAQTPLLDALSHPKFQNAVPFPTKINLPSTGTTVLEMAQKSQWLGLVNPANNAPLQTLVWGFGPVGAATYPGPTLVANSGVPVNVEWRNNLPATHLLPVDQTYHEAMPASGVPTVVHLHGGHTEPASDGHPEAWYTPNYAEKGATWQKNIYTYDNSQEGTTLWYHDHVLGMTRLNVYAGLAGFYFLNDANDQAVNLPRGNYDKEMVFQDKQFDNLGNLFFPSDVPAGTTASAPSGQPEFFGDFILVNGMAWPFMNVEARKYRFRLLNGSDSRVYTFALSNGNSFMQIGTDDGKLNTPSVKTRLDLAPGERAEIIVDFTALTGQNIKLLNYGPDGPFGNPGSPQADPATTGQIMEFRVNVPFNTAIANSTVATTTNLRPTLGAIKTLGASNITRKLALFEGTDEFGRIMPMLGIVDPTNPNNGSTLWHMPTTENIALNDTETWEIYNTTMDAHPIHLHLVAFQVLNKQRFSGTNTPKPLVMHNGATGQGAILSNIVLMGPTTTYAANDNGLKDTYVVQPGEVVRLKAKFDRQGQFVWHCHILSHEDHDMMRNFFVGNPCATDVTPPVLSACPANKNLTTTGTTAIASWTAPTATDNCSTVAVTYTTSPTAGLMNGGAFPIGTTTVNYMAMDANNNMSTCSFAVTVTGQTGSNICTSPATNIVATSNSIVISGITTASAMIQVFTSQWYAVTSLTATTSTVTIPNLQPNGYIVKVTVLGAGGVWPAICNVQQTVTVSSNTNPCLPDVTAPVLSACPANLNLTTTGTTAIATWTAPTATDNCSTPSVSFTTSPTAGLTRGGAFPVGTTTVTYMAMDGNNNMSTCSFTVTVTSQSGCATDNIPPVLTACPANLALTTTGTTAIATWTAPTATDNCSTPSVNFTTSPTVGLTRGGAFPIGTTTVRYTATDAKNNTSTCAFTVTVTQQTTGNNICTSPTTNIVATSNSIVITGITTASALIQVFTTQWYPVSNLTATTSTVTIPNLLPNGYIVKVTVLGAGGVWPAICDIQQTVTVSSNTNPCSPDVTPPVLTACPANLNLTTTGTTAIATWTAPTATDNCSTPSVSFTTSPTVGLTRGGAFPVGTTTVTYMAMDGSNNMSTCSFTVNVTSTAGCASDKTPPVLSACPTNLALTTTGTTAIATWTAPTATDNCSTPSVNFTTSPTASLTNGGAFPIGTTTVKYTATDAKNNTATCAFTVTVTKQTAGNNICTSPTTNIVGTSNNTIVISGITTSSAMIQVFTAQWYAVTSLTATTSTVTIPNLPSNGYIVKVAVLGVGGVWPAICNVQHTVTVSGALLSSQSNETLDINAQAQPTRTFIEWVNNTGFKNDYFTVEKANNTTGQFDPLAIVNNLSNDKNMTHYAAYDQTPQEGDNTYRIKVTYNDGSIKVSDMKTVQFKGLNNVRIFPNPANDVIGIDLSSYTNQAVDVYLYNYLGQQRLFKQVGKANNKIVELDVANQPVGNYMIRIQSKGKREVMKSVIIAH